MASWKMAKAFGRAMSERLGKDGKAAKAVNNSEIAKAANNGVWNDKDIEAIDAYRKGQREGNENFYVGREAATEDAMNRMDPDAKRIYDNYDLDYERAYGPNDAYNRAVELSGVEDAPPDINAFRDRYGFDISDRPTPRNSDISRQISKVEDENSAQRLSSELSDEIAAATEDATYQTMRKNAKDIPMADQFDREMAGINREALAKEIEDAILEALKRHGGESDATDIINDVTSKYR